MRKKTKGGFPSTIGRPARFCASLLAHWQWRRANRKRQRTGAVQDATARSAVSGSQCLQKHVAATVSNQEVVANNHLSEGIGRAEAERWLSLNSYGLDSLLKHAKDSRHVSGPRDK